MEYGFYDLAKLLGSLALFLYGMKIMSEALQKFAGDRLRSILTAMTTNRVTGVLTGMLITMLIQSSSATTVMVVSFVNAGLLTLAQSIGVIMGANIVVLNGAPNAEPDHVAEWKNDQRTIIVLGDEVIAPMAVKVELYSAQGALLNSVLADRIALNGLQSVVIAKATYEDGKVEIKKVAVK